jgi:hypothetical protein
MKKFKTSSNCFGGGAEFNLKTFPLKRYHKTSLASVCLYTAGEDEKGFDLPDSSQIVNEIAFFVP